MSWSVERLKGWAREIKRDVAALALAMRDSRTPFAAKVLAVVVVSYALSPIDLIPDFVPVLGYLDDVLLLPLGIIAVRAMIPPPLMAELRDRAAGMPPLSSRKGAAGVIILLWVASAVLAAWAMMALLG
jgi:uncharacterized membrane protein YkvA (DUF1232 family)